MSEEMIKIDNGRAKRSSGEMTCPKYVVAEMKGQSFELHVTFQVLANYQYVPSLGKERPLLPNVSHNFYLLLTVILSVTVFNMFL